MRFTARTWAILSVILFTGGFYSWYHGNEIQARKKALREDEAGAASNAVPGGVLTNLLTTEALSAPTSAVPSKVSLRLANTKQSLGSLSVSDKAILLRNALIDTSTGTSPEIPAHLRTEGESSSYVVQAKGTVGPAFRQALRDHGAELVSYIPNNAYLVRVAPSQVEGLKQDSEVGAVVVFEPYYKLAGKLLKQAVDETPIAPDAVYRLTLFPGQEAAARAWFENQGGQVLAVDRSPFGPQMVVRPPSVSLSALARLDAVQWVEAQTYRVSANDLTRVFLGVSADQTNKTNFLGLTGDKVVVNVNDFGFDTNYPALLGRILPGVPNLPGDTNGHGTFVATTLAGNGAGSDTVTNLLGSSTNGINLSGMATKAKLLALPLSDQGNVNDFVTDTWLQHTAASTNYSLLAHKGPMISNNSWVYENASEYDSAAARYDSAVRDSLPEVNGPQGMVFLFPAGNNGDGNTSGLSGESDSIRSPATAKNVITVGALEQLRYITNSYLTTNIVTDDLSGDTFTNVVTNTPLVEISDSSTEVASFSSRGNVGIGVEGDFGRFKPDVVAPGTVIVSGRSKDYKLENQYDTNSALYQVLTNIDAGLGQYRMDSGTSYAVPGVSGLLALLQEFFEHTLPIPLQRNLSPALTKALLINSSRSVNALYSLETRSTVNYQGWGAPGLGRILSSNLLTLAESAWPLQMVEQGASNALATGQSRTWNVSLSAEASRLPLRFTLVWTDPPGNPGAGIKLVNDLDLIITNTDLSAVFIGNDMANNGDFVLGRPLASSLDDTIFDNVNNVENVFIRDPSLYGTNFTVTVKARRVNVNAIGDFFAKTTETSLRTNDVVQDFALVMSTDLNLATNAFTITEATPFPVVRQTQFPATRMTNGLPLFDQRAGANATLVSTNGVTNQWHFFVFTNRFIPNGITDITNGSNVAFAIFNPPNLSTPRVLDADLDLYVSRDIRLFDLDPAFMATAAVDRSVERGGEELITYTNALLSDIFYVAVKSEDQKAGEFSILSVSSDTPFDRPGPNGSRILTGLPAGAYIPDGSGYRPRAGIVLAVGLNNARVRRVVVTNDITHELLGDLVGVLRHNRRSVTLNNHTLNNGLFEGFVPLVYNDSGFTNDTPTGILTDGPGSLRNFVGARMNGSWLLTEIDNQPVHTGRVTQVSIRVDPLPPNLKNGVVVSGILAPGADVCYPIDVPAGVTNLILRLTQKDSAPLALNMYIKRGDIPTLTDNHGVATNVASGGLELQVGLGSTPPISAGTWYVCIQNPNTIDVGYDLLALFEYGVEGDNKFVAEVAGFGLTDEAVSTGSIFEPRDVVVAGARVGLRVDHSRVSDLSFHLVSPQGTRLLLFENRGGTTGLGMGSAFTDSLGSNVFSYFTLSDDEFVTTPVKFQQPPFADFGTNRGQVVFEGFETVTNGVYTTGDAFNGWKVMTNEVKIISDRLTAATGTNSLALGTGAIRTNLPTVAGRAYQLRFKYRLAPVLPLFSTGKNSVNGNLAAGQTDQHYYLIRSDDPTIPLSTPVVAGAASYWAPGDANSQWITPLGYSTRSARPGIFTYRTAFTITNDPANVRVTGIWSADNFGMDIILNGKPTGTPGGIHTTFNSPILITTNFVKGINLLDLVTTNAGAPTGVRADLHLQVRGSAAGAFSNVVYNFPVVSPASVPGRFAVEIDGSLTNNYVSAEGYRTATIEFIASANDQSLTFASLLDGFAQLDDIELIDTGTIFVRPEEPFELLNGQSAKGMWRLEVEDFRTGAPFVGSGVISWRLDLDVATAFPPSETSRSGVTFPTTLLNTNLTNFPSSFTPGRVANNDSQYFFIPYCADSTDLQVTLVGSNNFGEMVLYADHSGFPTGNFLTDDYVPVLNNQNAPSIDGSATLHVTNLRPYGAPLNRSEPFLFVVVANLFGGATNHFTLRADFNGKCRLPFSFLVPPGQTNTLLVSSSSSAGVGGQQQLGFNVADGATTASLSLTPGDQGRVSVSVQGPPTWDGSQPYSAQFVVLGGVTSVLTLSQADSGHPIAPGTYQVTVDNLEDTPSTLDVFYQQGEVVGGTPALGLNSPQTVTVAANGQIQRDVTVTSDPSRLLFEVAGRPAGVDLVVRRQEDGATLTSHNGAPVVWSKLNAAGSLNGVYRVTVINSTAASVAVTLLASQPNDAGMLISVDSLRVGISADQRTLTFLSIEGEKYSLESSADLNEWEPVSAVIATGGQTTVSLPASQSTAQFYRLRQVPLQ